MLRYSNDGDVMKMNCTAFESDPSYTKNIVVRFIERLFAKQSDLMTDDFMYYIKYQ